MTALLAVLVLWVLIGAATGYYEARRGHWSWLWLLGAMAGPMVIPMARQLQREEGRLPAIDLRTGTVRETGALRVVAGIDGSRAAVLAAQQAAELLGSRLGELVLATVVDYEAEIDAPGDLDPDEPWDAPSRRSLDAAADELAAWLGFQPGTVLLTGRPAIALRTYAEHESADLVVVGPRGHGLSKHLLGSCAEDLVRGSTVPVIVVPTPRPMDVDLLAATVRA